jgi:hypothetical protein
MRLPAMAMILRERKMEPRVWMKTKERHQTLEIAGTTRKLVSVFSSLQEEGSGVVSDATTLDYAADKFTLISKAASGVITESEAADHGTSSLSLHVTLLCTSTQISSSNLSPRENARPKHSQEGGRRNSRLTEGDE